MNNQVQQNIIKKKNNIMKFITIIPMERPIDVILNLTKLRFLLHYLAKGQLIHISTYNIIHKSFFT